MIIMIIMLIKINNHHRSSHLALNSAQFYMKINSKKQMTTIVMMIKTHNNHDIKSYLVIFICMAGHEFCGTVRKQLILK